MEHIHLNMIPDGIAEVSHASQFDNGRQIRFNIFNGDSAYTLDGTETITMVVNGVEEAVANTSDNYVVWDVDASDCEEAGAIECELRIVKGGVKLGSKNFFLAVETDPYGAGPGLVIREAAGDPAEFTTNVADDAVECKIDIDYNANGYLSATVINSRTAPAFDAVPYLFRKSGGDLPSIGGQEFDTLVGGTVAWNQLNKNNVNSSMSGVDFVSDGNGNIHVSGTPSSRAYKYSETVADFNIPANHVCFSFVRLISGSIPNGVKFGGSYYNGSTWLGDWSSTNLVQIMKTTANTTRITKTIIDITQSVVDALAGGSVDFTVTTQFIDLTAMFGSTIADYIYSLEQATTGAGVAWFRKLFPNSYYPYDAGSLKSVKTTAHKMVGKNLFDGETKNGYIYHGRYYPNDNYWCNKNDIKVLPSTTYYFSGNLTSDGEIDLYDKDKNYLGAFGMNSQPFTTPDNCYYISVYNPISTVNNDKQLEIGSQATAYEPYTAHTYALDDVELRGLFKLDSNNKLYADGDTYESSGDVTRKYGTATINSVSTNYGSAVNGWCRFNVSDITNINFIDNATPIKAIATKALIKSANDISSDVNNSLISQIEVGAISSGIIVALNETTTADANTYLTSNPITIVFELATPTTETADAFTNPQQVDANGTEEYVDNRTIPIPVGHETAYGDDIKGVIVDFGQVIYGGELNLTTGTLTSTKNADGTDKATPDVYHLTPKQVEVRDGDNKIFGNTNGNAYVEYYARA